MIQVCLILLFTFLCPPTSSEEPYVVYPQTLRQSKSLDHVDEKFIDSEESVLDDVYTVDKETEILFGLEGEVAEDEEDRKEKSLLDTFPFNQGQHSDHSQDHAHHGHHGAHAEHGEHAHGDHSAHHGNHNTHDEHNSINNINRGVARSPQRQTQIGSRFPFQNVASNNFREGNEEEDSEISLNTIVNTGADEAGASGGRKCIDKVMILEETVYDEVITCDHSYDKRCHTTYVTNYQSQQEEECEENYRKVCLIDYEDLAYNSTVEICRTPLVKDCNVPGETVCQTIYESECATVQIVHEVEDDVTNCQTEKMTKCKEVTEGYTTKEECDEWPVERCTIEKKKVKKYTPETKCYKEPRELCAPRGCGFRNGTIECHNKVKTIVVENPVETCDMEPVRTCKHVTKLVPKLVPVEECADVPKEICARSKTNPKKIKKPVIKKWCYVPSEESGLL